MQNVDEIAQTLRVFLASVSTLGLATVDDRGEPHAANVNFAADHGLDLYFVSKPDSAHAQHIAARPEIAATAYVPFDRPEQIRGVQIQGRCEALPESDFDRVWQMFRRKFSYAAAFEERARSERLYRIRPRWFRMIDNSLGFGHKWETSWPPPGGTSR